MADKDFTTTESTENDNITSGALYKIAHEKYYKFFLKKQEVVKTDKLENSIGKIKKTPLCDRIGYPIIFSFLSTTLISMLIQGSSNELNGLEAYTGVGFGLTAASICGYTCPKFYETKEKLLQAKLDAATEVNNIIGGNNPPEMDN